MSMFASQSTGTMDGYVRVSRVGGREGDSYISPSVQREQIERWASYKGLTIAEWHVDEDRTGGDTNRPGLEAAIARVLAGETGGIVSARIDRFSRNTEDGLRSLRELEAVNARLAFVTEDIDTSGAVGRLIYTVMLGMATHYLDTIKAGWAISKERAVKRGAKIGPTPFGYRRLDDGTLVVQDGEADVLRAAFALAAREDATAAVGYLREHAPDRTWTRFTVERTLANRIYLGEVRYADLSESFEHLVVVKRAVWEAAQPSPSSTRRERKAKDTFPLSGLASCGSCGGGLVGSRGGPDARRMYRCRDRCEKPVATSADPLEAFVVDELRAAWTHEGFAAGDEGSPALDEAEAALQEAEAELDAFVSDAGGAAALRRLGRYEAALIARVQAVDDSRATFRTQAGSMTSTVTVLPDEVWPTLTPEELGLVLRGALVGVRVSRGRGPLADRVVVLAKGTDGLAGVAGA